MGIRDLFFKITARDESGPAFTSTNRRLRETDGLAASVSERMGRAGQSMQRFGAVGSIASVGVIAAFRDVIGLYDEQERAEAKVKQAILATGGAAGFTAEQLYSQAAAMQSISRFGDEEILNKVTAQFLTFKEIAGDIFEDAQIAALDLSTVLDGDLQSASIMLGKALNDPVAGLSAMSRAGITFNEVQAEIIRDLARTGDVAGAQRLILDEIATAYGGQAEAARQAGAGIVDAWQNTWGDVKEIIGSVIIDVLPPVIAFFEEIVGKFQAATPEGQRMVVMLGALAVAIPPITIALGLMVSGMAALAGPVGLVVAGIIGLTAAVALLWPEQDSLTTSINENIAALDLEASTARTLAGALLDEAAQSSDSTAQKYLEARARYENAKAAIAEHRAIAMASSEYSDLRSQMAAQGNGLMSEGPGPTGHIAPDLYDMGAIGRRLNPETERLLGQHSEMMAVPAELTRELDGVEAALLRIDGAATTAGQSLAPITGNGPGAGTGGVGDAFSDAYGDVVVFEGAIADAGDAAMVASNAIAGGGGASGTSLTDAVAELNGEVTEFSQSPGWQNAKDNLRALIADGQSWSDTWQNIFSDAMDRVFDLAFSPAWDALFQNLELSFSGSGGSGGGGGGGGILGGLGSFVGGILGLDTGGDVRVSGKAGVDRNLTVLRTSDSENISVRRQGDSGGGNVTVNIYTRDPQAFQASRAQVGGQIARAVAAGNRAS